MTKKIIAAAMLVAMAGLAAACASAPKPADKAPVVRKG